jgi:SpoVK/Ycf46/Vps4 family AAA+-type ATPase
LNILDGIIELHGVMIILTTNYPDRIDDALTRPGRIDFRHEFKRASVDIIKDMLKFKFDLSEDTINSYSQLKHLKDYVLSPAEIQNICFRSSDINDCLNKLISLMQKS